MDPKARKLDNGALLRVLKSNNTFNNFFPPLMNIFSLHAKKELFNEWNIG
jgi:hypothetical protein